MLRLKYTVLCSVFKRGQYRRTRLSRQIFCLLLLVVGCIPLARAASVGDASQPPLERDEAVSLEQEVKATLERNGINPRLAGRFHAPESHFDSDCHGEPCWVDADGRPVSRRILLKTNIPAWACLWQNLAFEIDILPHWSFELPVYWSPYDYGKRTLKFRTFSIIPKFRYWTSADNDGFFLDIHGGFAYYNIALAGGKRYQDHDGNTPALGGGIGAGYRFRLPDPRWKIEVALGAGVYALDYDVFDNVRNGLVIDRRKRTFWGIDNFAVSLSYEFYVRPRCKQKKGGAL